jgi:hypothetical protein
VIQPRTNDTETRYSGDHHNGLPTTRPYVYRGDGHDAIQPDDCGCGNCGNRIRYANQVRTYLAQKATER